MLKVPAGGSKRKDKIKKKKKRRKNKKTKIVVKNTKKEINITAMIAHFDKMIPGSVAEVVDKLINRHRNYVL